MDNITIERVCQQFSNLKFAFGGVWSADNFPRIKQSGKIRFQIVNTSPKKLPGTHWILIISFPLLFRANAKKPVRFTNIVIWNSLDISISYFDHLYRRLASLYSDRHSYEVHSVVSSPPIQSKSSNLCGLYCIYTALELISNSHHLSLNIFFSKKTRMETVKQLKMKIFKTVQNVGRMNEINLIQFFNTKLKTSYVFNII